MRRRSGSIDPQVAIPTLKSMDDQVSDSVAAERFQATVLTSFGACRVVSGSTGCLWRTGYSVSLRRQEFGIRIALGSGKSALIAAGAAPGGAAGSSWRGRWTCMALIALRWVRSLLYQTPVMDPLAIGGSVLLLLVAAAIAAIVPARRAASTDPMRALRTE